MDWVERVDKHVGATKRNPGRDASVAEPNDNVSFGSPGKAGFGQPRRQFAEEPLIHSVTIQKSCPGPAILELVTLRDLAEARQFKNGKRAVDRVNVEGRNSHADSPELPTPSFTARLPLALSGGCLVLAHRAQLGRGFHYRITVDHIGPRGEPKL